MTQTGWDAQSCRWVAFLTLPGCCSYRTGWNGTRKFPFGDGRELFNPCKVSDPVIETYGELSPI